MRIERVEAFHCDAGWRPWTFVKVETDDGLVGWGECSDSRNPYGIAGSVRDLTDLLIGEDPRIKAKALSVPVYELFGGPMRDRVGLYWSHCGTTRARHAEQLGLPPLRTYDDVIALGREVVERGFSALKTNVVIPGNPARTYFPGFGRGPNSTDGVVTQETLEQIETLIAAFSEAVGPKVQIALDLNYNFRPAGVVDIGRRLERFNMQWIEYDTWDPAALLQIKQSIPQRLASCESLVSTRQYRPFLEQRVVDTAIIDVPWNGFSQAHHIGQMADAYELTVAPHNYYSHLADLHAVHLCATLPNVQIMEIDVDDVPWKQQLVTCPPTIQDGHILLPTACARTRSRAASDG